MPEVIIRNILPTLLFLCWPGMTQTFTETPDMLDELPFSSLLKKRSVLIQLNNCTEDPLAGNLPVASALVRPLQHMQVRRKQPAVDRDHYEVEETEEEEEEWDWMPSMPKGKGKLSKIFDKSVTVLAFLAFGGYLICLLCNVFQDKQAKLKKSSAKVTELLQQLQGQSQVKPGPFVVPSGFTFRPTGRRRRRNTSSPYDIQKQSPLDHLIDSGYHLLAHFREF